MKNLYTKLTMLLLCLLGTLPMVADDITIDCKNGYSISAGTNVNVKLTERTFTAGEWTGFCIPFDASEEVLTTTFGSGYNLQEYSSYNETTNTVSFKKATAAKAGTPYFIKVSTTKENPTFSGVTIPNAIYQNKFYEITLTTDLILRGFYFNTYDYLLYGSNNSNTFYWVQADGTMKSLQDGIYQSEGRRGINAYIYRGNYQNYANKTPTLEFEGATSGGDNGNTDGDSGGDGNTGGEDSGSTDNTSLAYKIAHKQQLTDVPTIYLTIPACGNTEDDLNKYLYKTSGKGQNYDDAPYRNARMLIRDNGTDKSDFHFADMTTDTLLIKVRGNSTANPNASSNGGKRKKAYRIKFDKKIGASKHDMLGNGVSTRNWTLLANAGDNSMMRNAITYHLNKELGMDFCPGYKFVDLVINGNYRGTYQISDHVKAETGRVNVNEDTGWVVEFQGRQDMCDYPMMISQGLLMNVKNPEPEDETDEAQRNAILTPIHDWFVNTWQAKWKSTDAYSKDGGWRSVNDEKSLLNFWISTELSGDYDGWMTVKAYKEADESAKLCWGPIWDKDLAYGNYTGESSDVLVANASGNGSSVTGYLKESLNTDPYFTAAAKAKIDSLINSGLITRLQNKCDELAELLAQTQALNFEYYDIKGSSPLSIDTHQYDTYQGYVDALKAYLNTRFTKVQSLTNDIYTTANKKIDAVTYDPTKDVWNTGFANWDWNNGRNMNKLTDVNETNRTYAAGKWNTFCVPFDLTLTQVKAIFGSSAQVVEHTGMASDGTTMVFKDVTGSYLKAGYPYLLKFTGSDISNPTFKDVIITETASSINNVTYNGHSVTFDDKHYVYGTLFTASVLSTSTDYVFTNDVYEGYVTAIGKATNASIAGARIYLRVPEDETAAISINPTEELPATHGQLTSLPTIYISGTAGDSWSRCGVEIYDKDKKIGGDATYDATDTKKGVQFQYQGSGSGNKDSFRFKFDKKTQLLSSGSYKQWVLSSNDDDPTMLNNALAFDMSEKLGLAFTPKYQFVDLYVNDTYMGTYQLCDRVKAESGRALTTGGDKDSDWLVQLASKGEVKEEGDYYLAQGDYTPNVIVKNPDPDDYSTDAGKTTLVNEVGGWFRDTFFKDITSVNDNVNKEQLIKYYIAQEVLCTYKGLSSVNVWRSVTASDQSVYFGPVWDSEKSFGNTPKHPIDMTDLDKSGSYEGLITEYADYKIMRRFFKNLWVQDWFADGVVTQWQNVSSDLKTLLKNRVTTLAEEIKASRELNYSKASTTGTGWELKDAESYDAAITALNTYIEQRFAYLDKKFPEMRDNEKGLLTYNTSKTDAMDAWAFYNGMTVGKLQLKKRGTIHGGEWNMFAVPFALDASGIQKVFGSGAQVKEFSHTDETSSTIGLYFTAVSEMKAGVPYIVKPTADVAESALVFNNVTFSTDAAQAVTKGSYTLHGTLVKTTLTPSGTDDHTIKYLGTGDQKNTLLYLTQEASINGCRAYFRVSNDASAKKAVTFIDSETTEILTVEGFDTEEGQRVYNLNGQLLGTSLKALPHGIYIVGGRKVTK